MKTSSSTVQVTDTLLMVRPAHFGFNTETAGTNIFQHATAANNDSIHEKALIEFDDFVQLLRSNKIYVIVLQDPGKPVTPDSIFPNNWISFHEGNMVLYPMLAPNRRLERRRNWISLLKDAFHMNQVFDFSGYEKQNQFLEGTGSLVLDRINRKAYANLSSRTYKKPLEDFIKKLEFDLVCFTATDKSGNEIYHTNVLMAIGEKTAVVCDGIIRDEAERKNLLRQLSAQHEIVTISYDQVLQFAGNM
ncbi:MAG: arginine deiminase-related protein, partial [Chitinophagales bacterium]